MHHQQQQKNARLRTRCFTHPPFRFRSRMNERTTPLLSLSPSFNNHHPVKGHVRSFSRDQSDERYCYDAHREDKHTPLLLLILRHEARSFPLSTLTPFPPSMILARLHSNSLSVPSTLFPIYHSPFYFPDPSFCSPASSFLPVSLTKTYIFTHFLFLPTHSTIFLHSLGRITLPNRT